MSKAATQYLEAIYDRIVQNNELLLTQKEKPSFYIINNNLPFYFSLPGSQFFFSSSLIIKYLRNEMLLVSVLAQEIVKSQRLLYEKKSYPPVGYIYTENMLSLTGLDIEIKNEVNKWAYLSLRRAGYDETALLNWLQTQNKNSLDFTFMSKDVRNLSREEHLFKRFMVTSGIESQADKKEEDHTSSPGFYVLIRDIQKKNL